MPPWQGPAPPAVSAPHRRNGRGSRRALPGAVAFGSGAIASSEKKRATPRAEPFRAPTRGVVGERTVVLDRVGLETVRRAPRVGAFHPGLGGPQVKCAIDTGAAPALARRATRVERVRRTN